MFSFQLKSFVCCALLILEWNTKKPLLLSSFCNNRISHHITLCNNTLCIQVQKGRQSDYLQLVHSQGIISFVFLLIISAYASNQCQFNVWQMLGENTLELEYLMHIKDAMSIYWYPYDLSQTLQHVKYTQWNSIDKEMATFHDGCFLGLKK